MKPTKNYLLIELIKVPVISSSGIFVPGKASDVIEEFAHVTAVGPDVTVAKVGDKVYFKEYNIDRIKTGSGDDDLLCFLKEDFIIGVESK